MAISLIQGDDAVSCLADALCSGGTNHANRDEAKAIQGGSTGTARTVDCGTAGIFNNVFWMFDCEIPEGASWDAGTWTIPINFSSGDMGITLQEVHICRVNALCSNQGSLGSETGIGHTTNSGIYTSSISGSAVASPAAFDRVEIVLLFDVAISHSSRTMDITRDQTIICPFTIASVGIAPQRMLRGVG